LPSLQATRPAEAPTSPPDCRPLDEAFRDRFFFCEWKDDPAFELSIALGINEQANHWIHVGAERRDYCKKNGILINVSPVSRMKARTTSTTPNSH
jgi:hypothetical protein